MAGEMRPGLDVLWREAIVMDGRETCWTLFVHGDDAGSRVAALLVLHAWGASQFEFQTLSHGALSLSYLVFGRE